MGTGNKGLLGLRWQNGPRQGAGLLPGTETGNDESRAASFCLSIPCPPGIINQSPQLAKTLLAEQEANNIAPRAMVNREDVKDK
ncbi:MAG TPA: hypothetical protein VMM56_11940 [Planctomycetaceae bacterium]|nr:hypothetical protein [Planctomycetaceae bacterium]